MLINRDLVSHMAADIVKKLQEGELVEVKSVADLTHRVQPGLAQTGEANR